MPLYLVLCIICVLNHVECRVCWFSPPVNSNILWNITMSPINIIRPTYYVIYYMRFIFTDHVHCRQHAILSNYGAIHVNYRISNIFNEEETLIFLAIRLGLIIRSWKLKNYFLVKNYYRIRKMKVDTMLWESGFMTFFLLPTV